MDRPVTPSLRVIGLLFAKHANRTFGGGSATIAVLRQQLARREWITDDQAELAYGLSRFTPGTNLLAFCTSIGWTLRRAPGAVIALIAASLPAALIATLFAVMFDQERVFPPTVTALLRGAVAAAVAITVVTAWTFARAPIKVAPWRAAIIVPAATALALFGVLAPLPILLCAGVIGAAWPP